MTWVFSALLTWIVLWLINIQLAKIEANRFINLLVPALFGFSILILWEGFVRGFNISPILLPPPSAIAVRFSGSLSILWIDFVQTFIKGALSGYMIGCIAAFITAVAVDKSNFLKRGLLPVGNFVAALPIIGMAPILVMWFGFDWHSKAAVGVVMGFFPMLVNTVAGLNAKDNIQHDLMKTYGASYWQNLLKLSLPAAMPFIFNGLKICTTLALIGAIVSEFFGSPTRGMGFRISTEVGRLSLDMVWAEITVAALAGSAFYGLMALIEKGVTFWHPSQRK
ncbi:MAG: ABC transporter permease [Rhodobacterales bacterium]|nr:ABC transporter permease [Rhodobacterales bacterium]